MKEDFYKIYFEIKNKKYFFFLSCIYGKKGVDFLINVYNELFYKNKNLFDLVIVGLIDLEYV